MPSVKDVLDDVAADTNAVSAAQKGLAAVSAFVDDLVVKIEAVEGNADTKAVVKHLRELVTGLISAVPASVTPESAGPIGKSRAEQALETAEATVREHMKSLADILQGVSNAGEHIRAAAQAIADGRAQA